MKVQMPVTVVSRACEKCARLKITVIDEHHGGEIVDRELECAHYDDCLNAVDLWQKDKDQEEQT